MMKERTNPKSVAPRKVKGTVLFTVVCVMLILVVFLMGALALAATANNRAMKNYSEAQTQATAKAGVNALISAMQNDKSVALAAQNLKAAGDKIDIELDPSTNTAIQFINTEFDGTKYVEKDSNDRLGRITDAQIEYYGKKYVVKDDQLNEWSVIRFSATAEQGEAQSTVAVYMLRDDSTPDPTTPKPPSKSRGFVTTGGAMANNHTSAFGGTYIGFDKAGGTTTDLSIGNPGVFESPVVINGDLVLGGSTGGSGKFDLVVKPGEGLCVWGDLLMTKNENTFNIKTALATSDKLSGKSYKEVPYVFINGKFQMTQNPEINSSKTPLNIFCSYVDKTVCNANNLDMTADIYCFSPDETSKFGVTSPTVMGVSLNSWVAKIIKPGDTTAKDYKGGNFYTRGSVEFNSDKNKIANSVYVDKNMVVNQRLEVGGDVYVGGTLTLNAELKVTGTLYANTVNGSVAYTGAKAAYPGSQYPIECDYDKLTGTDTKYKIIETVDEIKSEMDYSNDQSLPVDKAPTVAANVYDFNGDKFEKGSGFITKSGGNYEVTDSCTLRCTSSTSTLSNCKITLKPSSGDVMYVQIGTNNGDGLKFSNNSQFYLDESSGGKAVLFLCGDISMGTDSYPFMTSKIKAILDDSTITGVQVGGEISDPKVVELPEIGLYIKADTNAHTLICPNQHTIFANVNAPTLDYKTTGGLSNAFGSKKVYYNGYDLANSSAVAATTIGCVGCCVINDYDGYGANNNWNVLYIPGTATPTSPTVPKSVEDALFKNWKILYYENY
jgi:Tfp pilus assembly protein PilX